MKVVEHLQFGPETAGPGWFQTTHWSVVVQAGDVASEQTEQALEKLCRGYWYPLYAYVRRKGHSPHDAQDLTQEFFARLLRGNYLATVERRKGKFRSFLLASLEHFLAKEWVRANRQKRGGGIQLLSLDEAGAEERYAGEPIEKCPFKVYERSWALALLEQALKRLQQECFASGKGDFFGEVKGLLSSNVTDKTYRDLAAVFKMSEGAFRVALHRLRQRYGELLREEILHTVGSDSEVDEEIRCLFAALSE